MAKFRAGLVGVGYWGRNILAAIEECQDLTLCCVCDKNGEAIKHYNVGVKKFNSVVEMLDTQEIDILFIMTGQSSLFELSLNAIRRNISIFVAKPVAVNTEQASILISEARKHSVIIHEDLTWLYDDDIMELKRLLDTKSPITFAKSIRSNTFCRKDISVLWDLAPHDVSIFNYLTESLPIKVSAVSGERLHDGNCAIAFVSLLYPNDIFVNIELNGLSTDKVRHIKLQGANYQIIFDNEIKIIDTELDPDHSQNIPGSSLSLNILNETSILNRDKNALLNSCNKIVHALRTRSQTLSSDQHIKQVAQICEALEQSLKMKGEWVNVF